MKRLFAAAITVTAAFSMLACEAGSDAVLEIGAVGDVSGTVWVDRNANGEFDEADGPVPGVVIKLIVPGSGAAAREPDEQCKWILQLQ